MKERRNTGDDGSRTPGAASSRESDLALHGRRLALLGSLVGGFAHEIKNPLSTIGLNLKLLEEELAGAETPREKKVLDRTVRLSREVARLQAILEGFLDYVRAPRPTLEPERLGDLVREVADLMAPPLEARGISIRLYLREGLPPLPIDRKMIHQALVNLVTNAEQAMTEGRGGEILIATGRLRENGRTLQTISVTDSGPGMPPEVLQRCFQPYYSTKRKGSGLGLAITRRLVEDHGGEIRVESHEGKGTRFEIRLPEAEEAGSPPETGEGEG